MGDTYPAGAEVISSLEQWARKLSMHNRAAGHQQVTVVNETHLGINLSLESHIRSHQRTMINTKSLWSKSVIAFSVQRRIEYGWKDDALNAGKLGTRSVTVPNGRRQSTQPHSGLVALDYAILMH